jgi:pseudaminic acid cytidylyltransferase
MTTTAVIPARGGSKRIPRKNVRLFHGIPAIARSIETAKNSGCFDRVVVSTDDQEIAIIAENSGAEVPFIRPAKLADDFSTTQAVVSHAIEALGLLNESNSPVCCIYPVTPLLKCSSIKKGLELLQTRTFDFVASVMDYDYPPQRALHFKSAHVQMMQAEQITARTQDLDEVVHDAGQFYWGWPAAWVNKIPIFQAHTGAIKLHRTEAVDVDTEADWVWCEALFEHQFGNQKEKHNALTANS